MRSFLLSLALLAGPLTAAAAPEGAFESGRYRNLFHELLGRTDREVEKKLQAAWQQFFYGDNETQRVFFQSAPTRLTSPILAMATCALKASPTE